MTSQAGLIEIAVLDDYQSVALEMADWSVLNGRARITVFRDHIADDARWSNGCCPSTSCA